MNTDFGYEEVPCESHDGLTSITYDEYNPEQEEQYDVRQYIDGCKERQEEYLKIMSDFTDGSDD